MTKHRTACLSAAAALLAVAFTFAGTNISSAQTPGNAPSNGAAAADTDGTGVRLVDKDGKTLEVVFTYKDREVQEFYRPDQTMSSRLTSYVDSKERDADYFDTAGKQRTHRHYFLELIGAIGNGGIGVIERMTVSVLDDNGNEDYKQYFVYRNNRWVFDFAMSGEPPCREGCTVVESVPDHNGKALFKVEQPASNLNGSVEQIYEVDKLPEQFKYWIVDRYAADDPTACCNAK